MPLFRDFGALFVLPLSRAKAILKRPEEHLPLLVSRARSILSAMQDNPAFPSPDPPLATLAAVIEALASAQASTHMRTLGEAAARDNKRRDLEVLLDHLCAYIQKIADTASTVEQIRRAATGPWTPRSPAGADHKGNCR